MRSWRKHQIKDMWVRNLKVPCLLLPPTPILRPKWQAVRHLVHVGKISEGLSIKNWTTQVHKIRYLVQKVEPYSKSLLVLSFWMRKCPDQVPTPYACSSKATLVLNFLFPHPIPHSSVQMTRKDWQTFEENLKS